LLVSYSCLVSRLLVLSCLFSCSRGLCTFLSFPTRRSSDLSATAAAVRAARKSCSVGAPRPIWSGRFLIIGRPSRGSWTAPATPRSEEHTSELQSRENLVCRLLLEKKKQSA